MDGVLGGRKTMLPMSRPSPSTENPQNAQSDSLKQGEDVRQVLVSQLLR